MQPQTRTKVGISMKKIQSRNKFFPRASTIIINDTKINVSFIIEKALLNKNGMIIQF